MDFWIGGLIALGAGVLGVAVERRLARAEAARRREQAREDAEAALRVREGEAHEAVQRAARREESLDRREESLDRREESLDRREVAWAERGRDLDARDESTARREEESRERLDAAREEAARRLAEVAGLSESQARTRILTDLDRVLEEEKARRIATALESAREEADRRAAEVVLSALERVGVDVAAEAATCRIPVDKEEERGRVIGREGRNVKAFEAATGCDVLVDEPPGHVTISCHDPLRREVARRSLVSLLEDGRVQPQRIEEVVADVRRRLDVEMAEEGRQACQKAGVEGLDPRLVELLGRLRYRTSYGQNVLEHSVEAAKVAGLMAETLGLDAPLARRAALLHDVGKAMDGTADGPHHVAASEVARRFGEPPVVVASIAASHDTVLADSPYAVLARVADAVSAARPGARREDAERFVRRLADLEKVAASFPGVQQAYAIQAGHEVRVIVDASKVSDVLAPKLAFEVARALEEKVEYPGEVKVTVVREVRATDVAR